MEGRVGKGGRVQHARPRVLADPGLEVRADPRLEFRVLSQECSGHPFLGRRTNTTKAQWHLGGREVLDCYSAGPGQVADRCKESPHAWTAPRARGRVVF